jgi:hypothetical protein
MTKKGETIMKHLAIFILLLCVSLVGKSQTWYPSSTVPQKVEMLKQNQPLPITSIDGQKYWQTDVAGQYIIIVKNINANFSFSFDRGFSADDFLVCLINPDICNNAISDALVDFEIRVNGILKNQKDTVEYFEKHSVEILSPSSTVEISFKTLWPRVRMAMTLTENYQGDFDRLVELSRCFGDLPACEWYIGGGEQTGRDMIDTLRSIFDTSDKRITTKISFEGEDNYGTKQLNGRDIGTILACWKREGNKKITIEQFFYSNELERVIRKKAVIHLLPKVRPNIIASQECNQFTFKVSTAPPGAQKVFWFVDGQFWSASGLDNTPKLTLTKDSVLLQCRFDFVIDACIDTTLIILRREKINLAPLKIIRECGRTLVFSQDATTFKIAGITKEYLDLTGPTTVRLIRPCQTEKDTLITVSQPPYFVASVTSNCDKVTLTWSTNATTINLLNYGSFRSGDKLEIPASSIPMSGDRVGFNVVTSNGCKRTEYVSFTRPYCRVDTLIVRDSIYLADVKILPTKIQCCDNQGFTVYPSPFTGRQDVTVTIPCEEQGKTLIIYDLAGRTVLKKEIQPSDANKFQISGLDPLPAGMYALCIITTENKKYLERIIKQ